MIYLQQMTLQLRSSQHFISVKDQSCNASRVYSTIARTTRGFLNLCIFFVLRPLEDPLCRDSIYTWKLSILRIL